MQNSGAGFDPNLISEMGKGMLNETDIMGYDNNDWSTKQTVDFGNRIQNSTNDEGTFKPTNTMQKSNNFVFNNSLCYTVCIIFCLNIYTIKIKIKFFVAYLSKRKQKRNKNKKRDNRFIKSAAAALWRKERKYYRNDNG